jgi:hypothetical protein
VAAVVLCLRALRLQSRDKDRVDTPGAEHQPRTAELNEEACLRAPPPTSGPPVALREVPLYYVPAEQQVAVLAALHVVLHFILDLQSHQPVEQQGS